MIGRYTRPEMGAIWELQNKFEIWKEIEVLACEAQAELGKSGITKEEAAWIREHANFTVERIDEIEKLPIMTLLRLPPIWPSISTQIFLRVWSHQAVGFTTA